MVDLKVVFSASLRRHVSYFVTTSSPLCSLSCPFFSSITSFTFSHLLFHVSLPFNCVCCVSLTNFPPSSTTVPFGSLDKIYIFFVSFLPLALPSVSLFFLSIPPYPPPSLLLPAGRGLSFCGGGFLPQCVGGSGLYHCSERVGYHDFARFRGECAGSNR